MRDSDTAEPPEHQGAASSSASLQPPDQPSLKLNMGESVLLLTSFVLFALVVLLQLWSVGSLSSLAGLWLLASYALLHTGGLMLSDTAFRLAMQAGAALAALSLVGAAGRWIFGRWSSGDKKQRVIGPGGRVLRVFFEPTQAPTTHRYLSWLPDSSTVFFLAVVVVRGLAWEKQGTLLAVVSCALILACLYLFSLYALHWLAELWIELWTGLFRFARGSAFQAGAVTMLLLGVVSWTLWADVRAGEKLQPGWRAAVSQSMASADLKQVRTSTTIYSLQRELLFATAESRWEEPAFVAGFQRFLSPLFEAARGARWSQQNVPLRLDGPLYAMLGSAVETSESPETEKVFQLCMKELYPRETSRAERYIVREYHQIKRADGYDIVFQALLSVCHIHSTRTRYDKLTAAFWRAAKNEANKRVDGRRKYSRELSESALGAPGTDCDALEPTPVSCPTRHESPEGRLAALETLAEINWRELDQEQCTVIIQKALLGWTDREIAEFHPNMNVTRAKDVYQNARRKIVNKLDGTCPEPLDFTLPELRRRLPAIPWKNSFDDDD